MFLFFFECDLYSYFLYLFNFDIKSVNREMFVLRKLLADGYASTISRQGFKI